MTRPASHALKRLLGPLTTVCVGLGVAVGSGIFRTPGEVATYTKSPWLILTLWVVAGLITLMQSLVTAELATRIPQAGAEYQYLKAAYGNLAAFVFGWAFTVFIVGGGMATIAAALGEFVAELMEWKQPWQAPAAAVGAIVLVTVVNALGLRTGALTQNVLTVIKILALLSIAGAAIVMSGRVTPVPPENAPALPAFPIIVSATLSIFWSYSGATDTAKLAEEIRDVHRALPRALVQTALVLTLVYVAFNYALLCAMSPDRMAGHESVAALIFEGSSVVSARVIILVVSILVCLGSLDSTLLSNVRVTYALARDGLTFRRLADMSQQQAPIASLIVTAGIACVFALNRSFRDMLSIYFMASAILFGMTYFSLIVFRMRDRAAARRFPTDAYRAPLGEVQALLCTLVQAVIAASIVRSDLTKGTFNSLYTLALLGILIIFYALWKLVGAEAPPPKFNSR